MAFKEPAGNLFIYISLHIVTEKIMALYFIYIIEIYSNSIEWTDMYRRGDKTDPQLE